MKCEPGDMAKIIHAVNPTNINKTVLVETYIGKFDKNEEFDFKGVTCRAPVADHYWWICAEYGLKNVIGDTPRAYIADSWLEPIRPTNTVETTEEDVELETHS